VVFFFVAFLVEYVGVVVGLFGVVRECFVCGVGDGVGFGRGGGGC